MSWLTVKEAAAYLHARESRIRDAVAGGELPAYICDGNERGAIVSTDDLDAYVRSAYRPAATPLALHLAALRGGRVS